MNNIIGINNCYTLRRAILSDIDNYYINFNPLNSELVQLTGYKKQFNKSEIIDFIKSYVCSNDKYLFFIISPDNHIVGETVINEIDLYNKNANFRIAIFQEIYRNKGLGRWATRQTCNFAFNNLMLHRLSLEVFSFNIAAQNVYLKCGFKKEGILREAIKTENGYTDIILMSALAHEWTYS